MSGKPEIEYREPSKIMQEYLKVQTNLYRALMVPERNIKTVGTFKKLGKKNERI